MALPGLVEPASGDDFHGEGWILTAAGLERYLAEDPETELRIGFAPACPGPCLTWEEHAAHIASPPAVEDKPEDVAGWERDRQHDPSTS